MNDAAHRDFKNRLYGQFARLAKRSRVRTGWNCSTCSPRANEPWTRWPPTSGRRSRTPRSTLQTLRRRRPGGKPEEMESSCITGSLTQVWCELCGAIRTVAEQSGTCGVGSIVRDHFGDRSDPEPVQMRELLRRARSENVVILDARPAHEYAAGHIAGAISVPIDDLQRRLRKLPKSKSFVAYCRGPYCIYADQAVEQLRASGAACAPHGERLSRVEGSRDAGRNRSAGRRNQMKKR